MGLRNLWVAAVCCVLPVHSHFYPWGKYVDPMPSRAASGEVDITSLIESGNAHLARAQTAVTLPPTNSHVAPHVVSHAGFATTDKAKGNHLFWWYFPALNQNTSAPLIIWLQGGPGGASTFGLFAENGPIQLNADLEVLLRDETWNKEYQMLFIDSPVGAGFSYTTNDGYCTSTRGCVAENLYSMISQFYQVFPEVKANGLYITGESYGGKYVPAFADYIRVENSKNSQEDQVPLLGIAVGDGWTDAVNMIPGYPDMLFNMGLIDYPQKAVWEQFCSKTVEQIQQKDFLGAFKTWDEMLNGDVFPYPNMFVNMTGLGDYDNFYNSQAPRELEYYAQYLRRSDVKQALHVGGRSPDGSKECEMHLLEDFHVSQADQLVNLLESGIDVVYYSGQLDIIIGTALTERFLQKLEWSGAEEYRTSERMVWRVTERDQEVAGWARKAKNFHFVTFHDAGHLVPFDQPRASRNMIDHMIKKIPYTSRPFHQ